ncbi:MAG TPA: FAD-linked oxidase C-terminal domain-containing protein [Gemmataceae bacterium]|nr:FAD-linked oxidase C-terminal domain-containing protein [Gemmataceae bacterium]
MKTDVNNNLLELQRDELARHLRKHVEGEVRFDSTTRKLYSTDASIYQVEPLGVVIPRTVADVVATVRIAGEMATPITARGAGTSLSGQSIGPGIILDCSKYLNRILDLQVEARKVVIEPGVVLDQLNNAVGKEQLLFGPEVSTSSRANLCGMIGNNSAGSRSIIYGKTIDHTLRLEAVLATGESISCRRMSPEAWAKRAAGVDPESCLYREVGQIVHDNEEEIDRRFPKLLRRVSGYNLDVIRNGLVRGGKETGLIDLLVGSEGTLGIITQAELNLVPKPLERGLLVAHYASLAAAMESLATCLEFGPSAVELLDRMLIDLARENLSTRETMRIIQGRPAALFMIEFSGDDAAEIRDKVERLSKRLQGGPGVEALVPALERNIREPLWNMRRASMPLLYGIPGDHKPVTFVEDTAVAPERLPEFIQRFRATLQKHGTDGAFYGHASVGCLHIRPLLDLKDKAEQIKMRHIMEDVTDLVLEFGGALSGEHGDGLVRSEWNRKMFGPQIYEAFRRVKGVFDPKGLLNPGKVVDAPSMNENLRYHDRYKPYEPATLFDYSKQQGFVRAIEMCNGSGVCRKQDGGAMCPSFRATMDEKDSTRGRANALRLALAGEQPLKELRSPWVRDVLDLCLMCKACKSECPSNVDMAKLKAEFLQLYYADRFRPLSHWLLAQTPRLYRWGAPIAPAVNWLQENRLFRWFLHHLAGIDRRRSLPPLHSDHLRHWFPRHKPAEGAGRLGRVVLFDDCFTTYNEPNIGRSAVRVLERAGYQVELAGMVCCGRTLISKGYLRQAKELVVLQARALLARLPEGVPLLGLEPSCILALADEWPELVPGPETQRLAQRVHLAEGWLGRQVDQGKCQLDLKQAAAPCVYHGHCHQKALGAQAATVAALRKTPGLQLDVLDAGCCGMAGSFGFETEHFDLSTKIAGLSLLPRLAKSPEAVVIASGTSCRHQILDLTGRVAVHPLEYLDSCCPK